MGTLESSAKKTDRTRHPFYSLVNRNKLFPKSRLNPIPKQISATQKAKVAPIVLAKETKSKLNQNQTKLRLAK